MADASAGGASYRDAALFTDFYQLTMLQAYVLEGMDETATFDLFVRRMRHRNYLVACGLDTALAFLEQLRFTDEAIAYLRTLGLFRDSFLDYLQDFRFTGDVYAMGEGTPVFADEPLLEVVAPMGEAQLVETLLLNQITFQTGIASKASRVVHAAQGRTVADFGMRRMHGWDAAMKAARACHVAGVGATSNVLAAQRYGLTPTGTMAHSYIEAHENEMDAFRAFAEIYPETTLLVDTYDTLDGVRKVIRLARDLGDDFRVQALRLDSGDLVALAKDARALLDDAGLTDVRLFASNSLDEHAIQDLLEQKAPIDGFGVGTRLGTMADQPYLDSVYKLSAYAGQDRMKLSSEKSNLPGRKQVYRFFDQGKATHDLIATAEETLDGTPLLECVMQGGERTETGRRTLDEVRVHCKESVAQLPGRLLALDEADPPYPVTLSDDLQRKLERVRQRTAQKADVATD